MKTLKRYLLGALSFCLIGLGTSHAQVSQVTWSNIEDNNGAGENFLSDAFGARLLPGNLVMIGSFDIPDATIQANSGNINYLLGHFAQYGSTTISGNGVGTPGLFYQNTIASSNNTTPFPVNGQQIYIWAFNSSLATTATQQGIFSQSALSNWIFPTDNTISNTTSVDLSNLTNANGTALVNGGKVVVGSFGQSLLNPRDFELALIPEPSTYALFLLGGVALFFVRRRFRSTQT